jgi:hypothetical protein
MRFDLIRNRFVSSFTFGSSNETLGGLRERYGWKLKVKFRWGMRKIWYV